MASSFSKVPSPSTNDLSIFRILTGNRLSWASDEYPVPKSSMARPTPISWIPPSMAMDAEVSLISMLSVTSITRASGGRPESASAEAMVSSSSTSLSWWAERLTVM